MSQLDFGAGQTVLRPESPGPGSWVGGPSAVAYDGALYLAYRRRRPIGEGRGFANVIVRTYDGIKLETLAVIERERHRADSLERPCLVHLPDGRWRLYISCATPGSKHWRVDLLEGARIEELADAVPSTVLPGDARVGVKDPVILFADGLWHLWASCHPLEDPAATDRMTTEYATSLDGVTWEWQGTALRGTPGSWEERTGVAVADAPAGPWTALPGPVFVSPAVSGGLRYLSSVADPSGGTRIYYESARADGSHELRTQLLSTSSSG